MWKKVIGWILFAWGIIGLLGNLVIWLPSGTNILMMVLNSGICALFIWGGWRLAHPKVSVKEMEKYQYYCDSCNLTHTVQMPPWPWKRVIDDVMCPNCGKKVGEIQAAPDSFPDVRWTIVSSDPGDCRML